LSGSHGDASEVEVIIVDDDVVEVIVVGELVFKKTDIFSYKINTFFLILQE